MFEVTATENHIARHKKLHKGRESFQNSFPNAIFIPTLAVIKFHLNKILGEMTNINYDLTN
jgi:hypothetical protein